MTRLPNSRLPDSNRQNCQPNVNAFAPSRNPCARSTRSVPAAPGILTRSPVPRSIWVVLRSAGPRAATHPRGRQTLRYQHEQERPQRSNVVPRRACRRGSCRTPTGVPDRWNRDRAEDERAAAGRANGLRRRQARWRAGHCRWRVPRLRQRGKPILRTSVSIETLRARQL